MRRIGGLFGRSPFGPIHEHILKVTACLEKVKPLVAAAVEGDQKSVERIGSEITKIEKEADELKTGIREQLTTSVFASASRSEILSLVKIQDDLADRCERLGYELRIRRTTFPSFIADAAKTLAEKLSSASAPLADILRVLDESGASLHGSAEETVEKRLEETRGIVVECEEIRDRLLRDLFAREDEVEPIDVYFMMRFAEHFDRMGGEIENVADIVTRLVAEGR